MNDRIRIVTTVMLAVAGTLTTFRVSSAPVVLISLDGLKPEYVTNADAHGLKLPILRQFMAEGSFAQGVIAVTPTVTYPNHTTMITGVSPAEHGIYSNRPFDPLEENSNGWYWYAQDVRVPTLWQAVQAAGGVTASIAWPVTVGARGIQFNVPEYEYARAGAQDYMKLVAALARPEGLVQELQGKIGAFPDGVNDDIRDDETRVQYALQILRDKRPAFLTLHLITIDALSHQHGPFSPEANAAVEALDAKVGRLREALLANDPEGVVVVVSDHGFSKVERILNWRIAFARAGLITLSGTPGNGEPPKVTDWKATLWGTSSAAVMLRDPSDRATREKVRALLEELRADPRNGISQVLEGSSARNLGAWPDAAFLLALKPGFVLGNATAGGLTTSAPTGTGTHGYLQSEPQMRAALFISGKRIARGRNLGLVDIRQLAPTLADLLGVQLPTARQSRLRVLVRDVE